MKQWPNIGSKITFRGTKNHWFHNMVTEAQILLGDGKEYTVSKLELASSWCSVILEEFPNKKFSLSWFEYPKDLTTNEVRELGGREK